MSETTKWLRARLQAHDESHAGWTNLNPRMISAALDEQDALIAALRAEVAALHKVVIDAMAELLDVNHADGEAIAYALPILDAAPEPSDDTLAAIEAQANE